MRKQFSETLAELGRKDQRLVFLTGDLGFNALEKLRSILKERFINAGVAEQNMVSVAAGMAYLGLKPWLYSITPFLTLKTVEQIRNDVCFLNLSVKFVGNGGGYGYGILGSTHHALEDIAIFSALPGMKIYSPAFAEDVALIIRQMHHESGPGYLRMNLTKSHQLKLPKYSGVRQLIKGNKITILILGHLVHNALEAMKSLASGIVDLWCITEIPFTLPKELLFSLKKTRKLFIIEEHVQSGGAGEKILAELLLKQVLPKKTVHLHAHGYPSKLYGSQQFHWRENQLDPKGIACVIKQLLKT